MPITDFSFEAFIAYMKNETASEMTKLPGY